MRTITSIVCAGLVSFAIFAAGAEETNQCLSIGIRELPRRYGSLHEILVTISTS